MDGAPQDPRLLDGSAMVVVPRRPGPLVRLADLDAGGRDDGDARVADVFGGPDDGGAGPIAAVLLLGGAAVVIAGLTALVPTWVLAGGVGVFVLGALLPLRSFRRRAARARQAARRQAIVGDGFLLRTDGPEVAALVDAHDRCLTSAAPVPASLRAQVDAIAHAAVLEVARLLDGRPPVRASELDAVMARTAVLEHLAAALEDVAVDAPALLRDLRGPPPGG